MTPRKQLSLILLGGLALSATLATTGVHAAGGPEPTPNAYRVLDPIETGGITLYPIVRVAAEERAAHWQFLTLDEGLKNGSVVITEAGRAAGLERSRSAQGPVVYPASSGDQVNTLVLLNNADRPLLLLAGEIVTGGKQDRIIAKDRIVPPHSLPLDLSVFCIEPHRWNETSAKFNAVAGSKALSIMVQPSVRRQAMAANNQQQVWNAVGATIAAMPPPPPAMAKMAPTSSYAQAMIAAPVQSKLAAIAAPALAQTSDIQKPGAQPSASQLPEALRRQHVIGVVAAINGHILWADIFATPEMLDAYWSKLVRSYAAESIHSQGGEGASASREAALRFAADPTNGHETSEGDGGVYRYSEIHGSTSALFSLEALLPGTNFEVHRTRMVQSAEAHPMLVQRGIYADPPPPVRR